MTPTDDLPATMRAICMTGYGAPDVLALREVPLPPRRADNDVVVAVHAAGVNPFETKLRRGWFQALYPVGDDYVPGKDIAGVVAAVGFDVDEFAVGDRVYGLIDTMRSGAYAEYAAVRSSELRAMPDNLDFEHAAAVPLTGCTAWHALLTLGELKAGDRVLVHAGAGGVGSMAIQIAKHFGAWVAATCSAANANFVRGLGADLVIDYRAEDFRARVSDLDIVFDTVGGETNLASYEVLKRGGRLLIAVRGDPLEIANRDRLAAQYGVIPKVVILSAKPELLDGLRDLIEAGAIQPPALTVLPLADAAEAHRLSETGHTRGKLVLKIR